MPTSASFDRAQSLGSSSAAMLTGVKAVTRVWIAVAVLLLGACQPTVPPLPPSPAAGPVPGSVAAPPPAAPGPAVPVALPAMDLPPGPIYRCAVAGSVDVMALPANIESLCRRHPEMGPCQYERDACRQRGGRVLTSRGDEVTLAVEAEYDRRVQRVRFRGDGVATR
ncbi:MAG: hypothetical protein IPF60_20015 [Betaproteobacteria bacterium]|nr:hypothetical protein [Betaproteobacteria bacterium]